MGNPLLESAARGISRMVPVHLCALSLALFFGAQPPHSHVRRHVSLTCAADPTPPPALKDAAAFARGALELSGTDELCAWWRQDPQTLQVVVSMPCDASFKHDVSVSVTRRRVELSVCGVDVLNGELANDVVADDSDWVVEDELDGFPNEADAKKFLVVDLRKLESYVEWPAPTFDGADPGQRRVLIGGKGEAQKRATAQQLASYQIIQKLPAAVRGDVYARVPPGADGTPSTTLYFVGKVIVNKRAPLPVPSTAVHHLAPPSNASHRHSTGDRRERASSVLARISGGAQP